MAQEDPRRGPERRGLARELIEAWAQRDLVEPQMTPERLAHTRRKRALQVLTLVCVLTCGIAVLIWATEPAATRETSAFWPGWVLLVTGLPVAAACVYVFARRPIKESPTRVGTGRSIATVLFTDIVRSTEHAQEVGDRRWRELLDRHDAAAEAVVRRHGGRLIKNTGDGMMATFDAPGQAIRTAHDLREEVGAMDIDIRAGIHTGEVEQRAADVGGIAVHIAARVLGAAEPGQVLVSRTVRDLVAGSDLSLVPRGTAALKGIEGEWELFLAT